MSGGASLLQVTKRVSRGLRAASGSPAGVLGIFRVGVLVLDIQSGYLDRLVLMPVRRSPPRGHDYLTGSTSNAGCLGAMARIWWSLESGPVPSKKIPTSAFHLLR